MRAAAVLILALLAGCGGNDDDCQAPPGYVCTPQPAPECHVVGAEYVCT